MSKLAVTAVYHDHDLQSLHQNDGVHPGAQSEMIANSLQVSEWTPVTGDEDPPFAAVGYQRASCGRVGRV